MKSFLLTFCHFVALVECEYYFVKIDKKMPAIKPTIEKNIVSAKKCALICVDKENRCFSFIWNRESRECKIYGRASPLKANDRQQEVFFQQLIYVEGVWDNPVSQCLDDVTMQQYVEAFQTIVCSGCSALPKYGTESAREPTSNTIVKVVRDALPYRQDTSSDEICQQLRIECDTNLFYINPLPGDGPPNYPKYSIYPVGGFDLYCIGGVYKWTTGPNDYYAANQEVDVTKLSCADFDEYTPCPESYDKFNRSCWKLFKRGDDECISNMRAGAAWFNNMEELAIIDHLYPDLADAKVEIGLQDYYRELSWSYNDQYVTLPPEAWSDSVKPNNCEEGAYLLKKKLHCGASSQATHMLCRTT